MARPGVPSPLPLPATLVETAAAPDGEDLRAWIDTLPRLVADVAARWSLRLDAPFQPGGSCSWVAPARDAAGRDRVLKVGWPHDEARHEADGLRLWAGEGAVRLHAAHPSPGVDTLLVERCRPGTALGAVATGPEQDEVIAGLLRRLRRAPGPGHPFRPLTTMCDAWADAFERDAATRPPPLDPGLARAGVALLRELPRTAPESVVLCTDLHAANVLAAEREPWLVVDPKPYVGDPAYDVLQHLLNSEERLAADPHALARRMADLLELDPERVTGWLFARCVQGSIEMPWLAPVAARLAPR